MRVLLSIKPKYAQEILAGSKRFEFRKRVFKKEYVQSVIIYATKPVGKIVGEFKVANILAAAPEELWQQTYQYAGLSKQAFDAYFADAKEAYAIAIKSPQQYDPCLNLSDLRKGATRPPQSFQYIRD